MGFRQRAFAGNVVMAALGGGLPVALGGSLSAASSSGSFYVLTQYLVHTNKDVVAFLTTRETCAPHDKNESKITPKILKLREARGYDGSIASTK